MLASGCGSSPTLPAFNANFENTVTVFAVRGTPLTTPSGYDVRNQAAIRLDFPGTIDFVFDIDDGGRPVFLPARLLGQPPRSLDAGLKPTDLAFDDILEADLNGYVTQDTVHFAPGDRFFVRSALFPNVCPLLFPFFGKIEILTVNAPERSVTFRALTDNNCGFRGLQPGIPDK